MKRQKTIPLSNIYSREEEFSADLADNLDALNIGEFEEVETEFNVNRRRADIIAVGVDEVLVVENQFGEANWYHWGRLEAYARSRNATIAALVAESFEDLMIVTCNRRNEDSSINWYLIQAQVSSHKEFFFHHVARPAIDIQIGPTPDIEYSEFWQPIRDGEMGKLFVGKPVPISNDGWITKSTRSVSVGLFLRNQRCYIRLYFNSSERRDKVMALFPESDYDYEYEDSRKETKAKFPVIDKGKAHPEDWDEIRERLVARGTDIYNKISESNL
ncbi:MAG: hypothetical protein OXI24_15855 [Candidatus Poribacteria bacterium]|nr:hypothetical protein [Candidatus Poribacteria bacterium]